MTRTLDRCAAAVAGLLASCGYSTGLRFREHMPSVGVAYFANDTLERDLERPLHDEISRSIRSLVDVPLESPDTAPVVLRGKILQFHRRGGIRSRENELLETGIFLEIEANLVDRATQRVMGPSRRASVWVGYTTRPPSNEEGARERAFHYVSEQIVLDLFRPAD